MVDRAVGRHLDRTVGHLAPAETPARRQPPPNPERKHPSLIGSVVGELVEGG
jgi:hypothetical protein